MNERIKLKKLAGDFWPFFVLLFVLVTAFAYKLLNYGGG